MYNRLWLLLACGLRLEEREKRNLAGRPPAISKLCSRRCSPFAICSCRVEGVPSCLRAHLRESYRGELSEGDLLGLLLLRRCVCASLRSAPVSGCENCLLLHFLPLLLLHRLCRFRGRSRPFLRYQHLLVQLPARILPGAAECARIHRCLSYDTESMDRQSETRTGIIHRRSTHIHSNDLNTRKQTTRNSLQQYPVAGQKVFISSASAAP